MSGQELTIREARRLLDEYTAWRVRRDEIILAALQAGVSEAEICRRTGHARTTIRAAGSSRAPAALNSDSTRKDTP